MNIIELYVIDGSKWTFIYVPRTISKDRSIYKESTVWLDVVSLMDY